jgi:hypothetical protein
LCLVSPGKNAIGASRPRNVGGCVGSFAWKMLNSGGVARDQRGSDYARTKTDAAREHERALCGSPLKRSYFPGGVCAESVDVVGPRLHHLAPLWKMLSFVIDARDAGFFVG